MKYKVEWVFKPFREPAAKAPDGKKADDREEMTKSDILMVPRCPLVDAYVHPEHVELLEQARTFRQIGKSDWEIEVMLNKSLDDKWSGADAKTQNDEASRPPRITVDIIRTYLQQKESKEASNAAGKAPNVPGSSAGSTAAAAKPGSSQAAPKAVPGKAAPASKPGTPAGNR
jgi:hypothetical protein